MTNDDKKTKNTDDILYLRSSRGLGNVICNLYLVLIWNMRVSRYKKIVLCIPKGTRQDSLVDFCEKIDNDTLTITDGKVKGLKTMLSLKGFLTKNYWSTMYDTLCNVKDPGWYFYFYFWRAFVSARELVSLKTFFNISPKRDIIEKIQGMKKTMKKYISMHIRNAEEFAYRKNVHIPDYFALADKYEDHDIYLATDNAVTQRMFIERYDERVKFCDLINNNIKTNKVRFTTPESIYIDIFVCKDAEHFMGTKESTFTRVIELLRFCKE